jgi:large subunit ribosomal protein L13
MGKNKPSYTPFLDLGDHVIIVNATQIKLTGNKWDAKVYRRHSGYPGGLKEVRAQKLLATHPERIIELAVRRMLPKTKMGEKMFKKLKVYAGSEHPHQAQVPKPLKLETK